MNSFFSRFCILAVFASAFLAYVAVICLVSSGRNKYEEEVYLSVSKVAVKRISDSWGDFDLGIVVFDLKANLTHLFDWNVKSLYVYLVAEYITEDSVLNHVIIWDESITHQKDAILNYRGIKTKPSFWDDGAGLRGNKNVKLHLRFNIIPHFGLLTKFVGQKCHTCSFPKKYCSVERVPMGFKEFLRDIWFDL